ncbi:MAG: ribbon-helix-helix domain-containing protein [Candidatus Sumerlaeia bacterium]
MKIKTSITLSSDLLADIDRQGKKFRSRSEFFEAAARGYLSQLARIEADRRDLEIISKRAARLNAEAGDVLSYQKIR